MSLWSNSKGYERIIFFYLMVIIFVPNFNFVNINILVFFEVIMISLFVVFFKKVYPLGSFFWLPILALIIERIVTLLISSYRIGYMMGLRDFIPILSVFIYIFLGIFVSTIILKSHIEDYWYNIVIGMSVVISLLGILEMLGVEPVRNLLNTYFTNEDRGLWLIINRRAATVFSGNPNIYGLYIGMCLIIYSEKSVLLTRNLFVRYLIFVILFLGLFSSVSFSAIGSTMFILLVKSSKKTKLLFLVVFVLLGVFIYRSNNDIFTRIKIQFKNGVIPGSLEYRINNLWPKVFAKAKGHYFFGIGPSVYSIKFTADNLYLDIVIRYGFLGLFVYLLMIFLWFFYLILNKGSEHSKIAIYLLLQNMMVNMVGQFFISPKYADIFWVQLVLALQSILKEKKESSLINNDFEKVLVR